MHIPEIFQLPLAVPFWLVFVLVFVREGRIVREAFPQAASTQDAGTFRLIMIGSPLASLAAIAVAFQPRFAMPFPAVDVAVGIVLMIAGGVLRRACFKALGASFTGAVAVRPDQVIVQHGVYRWVRHPSYSAALLMFTGVGVALGNWISVAVLLLVHCVLYGVRVAAEEKAFLETLGEPYRDYMSRTRRFIPFVV